MKVKTTSLLFKQSPSSQEEQKEATPIMTAKMSAFQLDVSQFTTGAVSVELGIEGIHLLDSRPDCKGMKNILLPTTAQDTVTLRYESNPNGSAIVDVGLVRIFSLFSIQLMLSFFRLILDFSSQLKI